MRVLILVSRCRLFLGFGGMWTGGCGGCWGYGIVVILFSILRLGKYLVQLVSYTLQKP